MKDKEKQIILKHFINCKRFFDEQNENKKQIANERFPMSPTMYHIAVGAYTEMISLIKELGLSDYVIDELLQGD